MKKVRQTHAGVTLVEMLIVVAIIGIMAGIGVPNFTALIRNHRTRSSAMTLLADIRSTRSRAISLNRELSMEIIIDNAETDWTKKYLYTIRRSAYIIYDPLDVALGTANSSNPSSILFQETEETLEMGTSFNINKGLREVVVNGDSAPDSIILTFNPSGTIFMATRSDSSDTSGASDTMISTFVHLDLIGRHRHYEIVVYKGGQVNFRAKAT